MPPSLKHEQTLWQKGYRYLAGLDEAGRGCLAGPVVAAAVVLAPRAKLKGVDDSKKLSPKEREHIFVQIQKQAVGIGIALVMPEEIEALNILRASLKAMKKAVERLPVRPDYLLVDGPYGPDISIPTLCLKHGDRECLSIAAASIIAKVCRDQIMNTYHTLFPVYNFKKNKGYPTAEHKAAILKHGLCYLHRYSFKLPRYD
jgi:ribonuclease HII